MSHWTTAARRRCPAQQIAYFFGFAPESFGTSLLVVAANGVAAFAATLSFFGFLVSLLLFACPLAMVRSS